MEKKYDQQTKRYQTDHSNSYGKKTDNKRIKETDQQIIQSITTQHRHKRMSNMIQTKTG